MMELKLGHVGAEQWFKISFALEMNNTNRSFAVGEALN